jgi:hypothetical protein
MTLYVWLNQPIVSLFSLALAGAFGFQFSQLFIRHTFPVGLLVNKQTFAAFNQLFLKRVQCLICELGHQFGVSELLRSRWTRHVGTLLGSCFTLI